MVPPTSDEPFPFVAFLKHLWPIPLVMCVLLTVLLGLRLNDDSDLGFHLRTGQWIVQNHAVPIVETYTYSVPGNPYVDLNWFYQLMVYGSWEVAGYPGVTILHLLAILSIVALLLWRMRIVGVSMPIVPLFLAPAIFAMEFRFVTRPEVFSWLYFSAVMLVLEKRMNQRGAGRLWLLPVIQIMWVNTHSLFVIGLTTMAMFLVGRRVAEGKWDVSLAKWSGVAMLAGLINPYFYHSYTEALKVWVNIDPTGVLRNTILELQSPLPRRWVDLVQWPLPFKIYWLMGVFGVIAMIGAFSRHRLTETLIYFSFLILSLMAMRNINFYVLAALPAIATASQICWTKFIKRDRISSRTVNRTVLLLLMLVLLLMGLRVVSNAYYIDQGRSLRFGLGLDREKQPVGASDFLVKNRLTGRILNDFNTGSWLVWAVPQPVYMHANNELMGRDFYLGWMDAFKPYGLSRLIAANQPELIIYNHRLMPNWTDELKSNEDWRLIYLDEVSLIYARKDYASDIPSIDWRVILGERGIRAWSEMESQDLLRREMPSAMGSYIKGLFSKQEYPMGLARMAYFASQLGERDVARNLWLQVLDRSNGRRIEPYVKLAQIYQSEGRSDMVQLLSQKAEKLK